MSLPIILAPSPSNRYCLSKQYRENLIRLMFKLNNCDSRNCLILGIAFFVALFVSAFNIARSEKRLGEDGECTIAVFGGTSTSDGRPIIWKNRDVYDHDQRFIYYSSYIRNGISTIPFIGNVYRSDTTRVYMGANAAGFAIMNSDSYNLDNSNPGPIDDGTLMRLALETCASLSDFEMLLDSTNNIGRHFCWNFGVLDSSGACALYECSDRQYIRFNSFDESNPVPGIIVRSNFSLSGGSTHSGQNRYDNAVRLCRERPNPPGIDVEFVAGRMARDLNNNFDNPYPLPYHGVQAGGPPGYIYDIAGTISNRSTSSAVVIRGVLPDENPSMTTIFAILGPPILSVAFPLWVASGSVPECLSFRDGALINFSILPRRDILYSNNDARLFLNSQYLFDDQGRGVYSYTLPLERWGINESTRLIDGWRNNPPDVAGIGAEQNRIASIIFTGYQFGTTEYIDDYDNQPISSRSTAILVNYPNPFNDKTTIYFSDPGNLQSPTVNIYDMLGRFVRRLKCNAINAGSVEWDGNDEMGNCIGSGIYLYSIDAEQRRISNKMILLK